MNGTKGLLAIASLALLLMSCTALSLAPGAGTQAVPSPTPHGTRVGSDLVAVLEASPRLPNGEEVNVKFTLTNNTDTGLFVLTWFTPLEGLGGDIFRVMRDGQPIPYEGPLAARGDPSAEAYVYLDAGASVSATVDLAAAYDFSEPGEYTIAFVSPRNSHVARTEGEMAGSVDNLGPVAMPCDPVSVTIVEDLRYLDAKVVRNMRNRHDQAGAPAATIRLRGPRLAHEIESHCPRLSAGFQVARRRSASDSLRSTSGARGLNTPIGGRPSIG